jgi:hypothetical protein
MARQCYPWKKMKSESGMEVVMMHGDGKEINQTKCN